jgi:hypothetical protein
MTQADRAAAEAKLVVERLATLSADTGMSVAEIREMWLVETADRLERALAAASSGDLAEARRQVHSAAGSTGMCGADALATDLTTIENLAAAGNVEGTSAVLAQALADFRLLTAILHREPA